MNLHRQVHEDMFGWLRKYTPAEIVEAFREAPALRFQSRYVRQRSRRLERRHASG